MIKGIKRYSHIIILASFVLLSSCNNNIVYTDSTSMPGKRWDLMNILSFRVPVEDTLSSNNVTFTIRSGSSYPFRNIYFFVKTISPDGKSITDTLEYFLADEKGAWFGRGFGDVHELNLPYKSNVFFPRKGIYQFNIQHGMRKETLDGIYDIGLRIEKTGKQINRWEKIN
jgi:gliding motility-associated lipoprotein GldH